MARGCNLNDPESVQKFLAEAEHKKTNVRRYQEAHGNQPKAPTDHTVKPQRRLEPNGNGELPAPGRRGAGGALRRLEEQEERGYARLQLALERGDPIAIDAAQTCWPRVAEVLRRLDRELEISRRSAQERIPLKTAQDAVTFGEWLRIWICVFLSSEGLTLAGGIKTVGDLKAYFFERFRGVMFLVLKNAERPIRRFPTGQRNGSKAPSTCKTLRRSGSGRCFRADHAQVVAEARIVGCGFLNVFCLLHSAYCISCISRHLLCWR